MARKRGIRWELYQDDLNKAVKNFNAKITRLEKKNPELKNALPEKVSVRQIKQLVDNRNDVLREIKALQRFTKRGSEQIIDAPNNQYNLKLTKWQKEEMTRRTAIINRKRKVRRETIAEIEMTSRGKKLGYKRGDLGMGSIEDNALKPFKAFPKSLNRSELEYKWKNILKESQSTYWTKREQIHKDEYVKAMLQSYQYEDVKDIVDRIEKMDYKEFRKVFEAEGGTFDFVYQPPDLEDNYEHYLNALKSQWIPNKPNKTKKKV